MFKDFKKYYNSGGKFLISLEYRPSDSKNTNSPIL